MLDWVSPQRRAARVTLRSASKAWSATIRLLGFRGVHEAPVWQAGADYARDVIPSLLRPNACERVAWHKARGDTVVVVSASLAVYLSHWCREVGVDLIATELEAENGILTGRCRQGDCSRHEKKRRVLERYQLGDYGTVYAYGDTRDDRELLGIAHKKFYRWREL
jgi:phosphatidylglycerophosphatase C